MQISFSSFADMGGGGSAAFFSFTVLTFARDEGGGETVDIESRGGPWGKVKLPPFSHSLRRSPSF